MPYCIPPDPLNLSPGVNELLEWTSWKEMFVFYLKATESFGKSGVVKGNILLASIGDAAIKVYKQFTFAPAVEAAVGIDARDAEISDDYDTIIKKFDEYFQHPKRDGRLRARIHFYRDLHRGKNQTLNSWIDEVTAAVDNCGFPADTEEYMIRDRLLASCTDNATLDKVFDVDFDDLSLNKLIRIMRVREDLRLWNAAEHTNLTGAGAVSRQTSKTKDAHDIPKKKLIKCKRCGGKHQFGKKNCPAADSTCLKCNKLGHYASQCRSKSVHAFEAEPAPDQSVRASYKDEPRIAYLNSVYIQSDF